MKKSSAMAAMLANYRVNPRVIIQNVLKRFNSEPLSAEEMTQYRWMLMDQFGPDAFDRLRAQLCRRELQGILDRI